jgi:hypothetical protein
MCPSWYSDEYSPLSSALWFTPERIAPEQAPLWLYGHRARGQGRVAPGVIRLPEEDVGQACRVQAIGGVEEGRAVRHLQDDQVAGRARLDKAPPGLQAGVAHLDDLIGERDVPPDQHIGEWRRRRTELGVRHGPAPPPQHRPRTATCPALRRGSRAV